MRIPPPKKRIDTPGSVKVMVDKIVATPVLQLADVFPPFAWVFGKGDLMHWVPVLNHFDAFFQVHVSGRSDLRLADRPTPSEHDEAPQKSVKTSAVPFPTDPLLWAIRASIVLLENCANRQVYNSGEFLGDLLSADDTTVALDALRLLSTATRRAPGSRGNKFKAPASLRSRLLSLCGDVPDLAADAVRIVGAGASDQNDADESSEPVQIFGIPVRGEPRRRTLIAKPPKSGAASMASVAGTRSTSNLGKIHFVFYCPGGSDPFVGDLGAAGRRVVVETAVSGNAETETERYATGGETNKQQLETDREVTNRLAKKHGVPYALRFSLFARARLARLESSTDATTAFTATQFRLLALCVLLQSDRVSGVCETPFEDDDETNDASSDAAVTAFLAAERPEVVAELFRSLRFGSPERCGVPTEVVEASLRALAALAGDRTHATSTLAAMRARGHPAILTDLVSQTVANLASSPSPPTGANLARLNLPKLELDAINRDADKHVPNADALVALLSTLVTTHGGCLFLRDVSLLPSLTPLLKNRNPRHVHVVSHAVHALEIFMDYASQASAAFRDLGGMRILVERLELEAEDALAEHAATHGGGEGDTCVEWNGSESETGAVMGDSARGETAVTAVTAETAETAVTATGATHAPCVPETSPDVVSENSPGSSPCATAPSSTTNTPTAPPYLVSSTRRVLLKALMRALALVNFSPGTANVKVAGLEDGTLSRALVLIFKNPKLFGAGVFSLAANLLCDVMNHEPTCYPTLEQQNVPQVFLEAWEGDDPGPSPSADVLCCLPNALGALCLSPLGLQRVKQSTALDALITAFTTRQFARAMLGETAAAIGGNIDELLRHVPDLQQAGVKFAVDVLRRLLCVGGVCLGEVDPGVEGGSSGEDSSEAQPSAMETDGDALPGASTSTGGPGPRDDATTAMTPTTKIPPLDLTPPKNSKPGVPPISASFLAEAVANVAKLIDSMLPTEECAKAFVDQGGVALLVRLHAMPYLSPTFSSSSACHALSVTLRSFAGRSPYSHVLTSETQRTLRECVRVCNAEVVHVIREMVPPASRKNSSTSLDSSVGPTRAVTELHAIILFAQPSDYSSAMPSGVPKNGIARKLKETLTPLLATTMAILNLTTSLLRSSPGAMVGLLNPHELDGRESDGEKDAAWKTGGVVKALVDLFGNTELLLAVLLEGEGARTEAAFELRGCLDNRDDLKNQVLKGKDGVFNTQVKDDELTFTHLLKPSLDAVVACQTELARFRSSFNYFCSSLVKNVANARARAPVELCELTRMPIAELSVYLTQTVHEHVRRLAIAERGGAIFVSVSKDEGEKKENSDEKITVPRGVATRNLCELFGVLHTILIDERRHCSQGLVLNYMDQSCGLAGVTGACNALWRVAEREALAISGTKSNEGTETEIEKGKHPVDAVLGVTPDTAAAMETSVQSMETSVPSKGTSPSAHRAPEKHLPAHVTSALKSASSLLSHLIDVEVLFGSSGGAANVVAPRLFHPTHDTKPTYPPQKDPRVFAARLHETLAPAVLAAWRSTALRTFPPDASARLMETLVHLGKGVSVLPERVAQWMERERNGSTPGSRELSRHTLFSGVGARGVGPAGASGGTAGTASGAGGALRADELGRWVTDTARRVAETRAPAQRPTPFVPSPTMTSSICEMGFSEPQARAALIAVRGRSIEIAMDWLFSHPAEAGRADEEAAAAAATPTATATPASRELPPPADETQAAVDAIESDLDATFRLSLEAATADVEAHMGAFNSAGEAAMRAIRNVTEAVATSSAAAGATQIAASPPTLTPTEPDPDAELMRALEMSMADEETVALAPGRSPEKKKQKTESPRPEVPNAAEVPQPIQPPVAPALPKPTELLGPILALSGTNPSMVFSGAKLLARELRRASDTDRVEAVRRMVELIRDGDAANGSGALDSLVHFFVLVLVSEPKARKDAANAGAVELLLQRVSTFLTSREHVCWHDVHKSKPGDAAVCPKWVTGCFLALHKLSEWRLASEEEISASKRIAQSKKPGSSKDDDTKENDLHKYLAILGNCDGYLIFESRERASELCVRLLKLVSSGGRGPEAGGLRETTSTTIADARTSDTDVGGVQAAMQLLVHLTKDHAIAVAAHNAGIIKCVLDLPMYFAFQAYDALASAVLRHVAEDPRALQLAMESELHAVLSVSGNTRGVTKTVLRNGSIGVVATHVLTHMFPVLQRSPKSFIAALAKCAYFEKAPTGTGTARCYFSLKNQKENEAARVSEMDELDVFAATADTNSTGASSSVSKPTGTGKGTSTPTKEKGEKTGEKIPSKPNPVFASVIQSLVVAVKAYPPRRDEGADTAAETEETTTSAMDTGESTEKEPEPENEKGVSAPTIAAVRASLALRLLTDFALVYSAAAGAILKHAGGGDEKDKDGLLTHVLYSQLAGPAPVSGGLPADDTGWDGGERAAYFLLAMCVRSCEARRRVLSEVVKALTREKATGFGEKNCVATSDKPPSLQNHAKKAFTPARAFVEFVNSLVKTAGSKAHLASELQKGMRDTGLLSALCAALDRVDLDDIDASGLVRAMLRPMETLTKPSGRVEEKKGNALDKGRHVSVVQGAGGPGGGAAVMPSAARHPGRRRSADGAHGPGAAGRAATAAVAPGTSPGVAGGVSLAEHHARDDDPATMARMGDEASRMFDTLMGGDEDDAQGEEGSDEEGLSGEDESGEEDDESGSDEDEDDQSHSGSDSEDPSGIDPMDDDEEHEEAALNAGHEDDDELEARQDVREHHNRRNRHHRDDHNHVHDNEAFEYDDALDDQDLEDVGDERGDLDDVPEDEDALGRDDEIGADEDDVINMDDDDEEDELEEEEWEEAGDPAHHGDGHLGFHDHDEFVMDDGEMDGEGGGDDDDDDDADGEHGDATRRAADQLAGRLQGIIAEAQRRGGDEPVIELRVRDMRLRELVAQHGGGAILNGTRHPFDNGQSRGGGAGGVPGGPQNDPGRDLGQGGILSDIFALRRSLEDARRDQRLPHGDSGRRPGRDSAANRASAFESNPAFAAGTSDAAFAGPAMHPMLLRPSSDTDGGSIELALLGGASSVSGGAGGVGSGAGGVGSGVGGRQSASLRSVLASISGEMSRLAVAPGGDPRAGGGNANGGRGQQQLRTDSGFVVLPEVESLGSLLRIERADGRNGRPGGGFGNQANRRGLSVAEARVATWQDVAALGPNEETPAAVGATAVAALEEFMLATLDPTPQPLPPAAQPRRGLETAFDPTRAANHVAPEEPALAVSEETASESVPSPETAAPPVPASAVAPPVPASAVALPVPASAVPSLDAPQQVSSQNPEPTPAEPELEQVDSEFLNALPVALRTELINANAAIARLNESLVNDAASISSGNDQTGSTPRGDDEIMTTLDPEFLAALPPDMQAEVVQQQTREVQRHARNRVYRADRRVAECERARGAAIAAIVSGGGPSSTETDTEVRALASAACRSAETAAADARAAASVVGVTIPALSANGASGSGAAQSQAELINSFPPEARADVLLAADRATLAALPQALQEEARALGNRAGEMSDGLTQVTASGSRARRGRGGGGANGPNDNYDDDVLDETHPGDVVASVGIAALVGGDVTGRTFAQQLRSMLGLSGPGPSGGRNGGAASGGALSSFGLTAADRATLASAPSSPLIDRNALFALLRLHRLSPALSGKANGTLPRVLLNVAAHPGTRDVLIRALLATTRVAVETTEAIVGGHSRGICASPTANRGCGTLYGRDAHVTCPSPEAAARFLARRALETLVFLTRSSNVFAARVAVLAVTAGDVAEAVDKATSLSATKSVKDTKGKKPVVTPFSSSNSLATTSEEGDADATGPGAAPLVLLSLLGSPAFEPHAQHVELALSALLSVLAAMKRERERFVNEWRSAAGGDATFFLDFDEKLEDGDDAAEVGEDDQCTQLKESKASKASKQSKQSKAYMESKDPIKHHLTRGHEKGQKISTALEPWRLGFLSGGVSEKGKGGGDSTRRDDVSLGGLRPLASSTFRKAIASAPPGALRALASLVARDALTAHAQTKAAEAVRFLAVTAPEARVSLAAAFAAEAKARAGDAVAALLEAGDAARLKNAADAAKEKADADMEQAGGEGGPSSDVSPPTPTPTPAAAVVVSSKSAVQSSRRASALAAAPAAVLRLTRAAAATLKRDESVAEELRVVQFSVIFEKARLGALSANKSEPDADKSGVHAVVAFIKTDNIKLGDENGELGGFGKFFGGDTSDGNADDAVALRDALGVFANELEPVWDALGVAALTMEQSPSIATAGGTQDARARHLGLRNSQSGLELRQILPIVEARFVLAAAVAQAERDAETQIARLFWVDLAPGTDPEVLKAVGGAIASATPKPKPGPGRRAEFASLLPAASPVPPVDDPRAAFGLARVGSPAFGLAGRPDGRAGVSHPDGGTDEIGGCQKPVVKFSPASETAISKVWNFANAHRAVVNALVRSAPNLLTPGGSLEVLLEKPRLLDFDNKVVFIRSRLKKLAEDPRARSRGGTRVTINRKQVLTDSFARLQFLRPNELRGRVMIEFLGEEGIDAGGLTREWYVLMAREMFNPDAALFELSPSGDGSYQPYENSGVNELHLSYFKFIGRVIGKAVFDGYLVDAHFTRPFYKHLLGIPLNYDDLEAFDPEFHKSLAFMLAHPLCESGLDHLMFSETANWFGVETEVELIPDGKSISVTDENKLEYVNLVAAHRMTDKIREQIAAFSRGFNEIVPHEIVKILNPSELELLISGTPSIDVEDLRNNTEYQGYSGNSPQVRWFWEVVREDLTEEDQARLLMFVTGTSKVPLDGFKALQGISGPQKFQIHRAYGAESGRLCSAHTCFNQLDLPEYTTKEELRDRLLFAISEGSEGFGFG